MRRKFKYWAKIISSKLFMLLALIVLVFLAYATWQNYDKSSGLNKEVAILQAELDKVKTKNLELQELTEYFATDFFVEETARKQLGLAKEGEQVVVIKNDSANVRELQNALAENMWENPGRWFGYFFGQP